MTIVSGRNRVNRPYFFTQVDGSRAEFPSMETGTADLEGRDLTMFNMLVKTKQIDEIEVPQPEAPVNTVIPKITGTPEVGSTLTVNNGTWTGNPAPTFARQWYADGVAIPGETKTTYTVKEDDVGKVITAKITATNSAGTEESTSVGTEPVEEAELPPEERG